MSQEPHAVPVEPSSPSGRIRRKVWVLAFGSVILAGSVAIIFHSIERGSPHFSDAEITAMLQPLAEADKVTLYSFNGDDFLFADQKSDAVGEFYGCPILGTVEISGRAERKEVVESIATGIRDGRAVAACFWPHHAIRAESNGKNPVDYIICFKCSSFRIRSADAIKDSGATTNAAQKVLNRILKKAGIPIAE